MRVEKIINIAYSFGAAIVVFGSWAKLEHKSFADEALTTGFIAETSIFCIYGLMEWFKKTEASEKPGPVRENAGDGEEIGELTATMKQTNQILSKVFKAGQ